MKIDKLILKDFLSYDYLDYDFPQKPIQVQGLNFTDDNQKSCGSGKSGIQTAIEFSITGTNSRGVRDIELITYGKQKAEVQLFISCDFRKRVLKIQWIINRNGSNVLTLKIQEYGSKKWEKVNVSGVADGKKYIDTWLAISKDDLFNYYLVSKKRFKSFFSSSNKEKVDLINRFSDASIIEGLENIDTEHLDEDYKKLETKVNKTEGAINQVNEQIDREKNRDFKNELKESISELQENIELIEEGIFDTKQIQQVEKEKNKSSFIKIKNKEEKIRQENANKADIEVEIVSICDNVKSVEEELKTAKNLVESFVLTNWDDKRKDFNSDSEKHSKKLKEEKRTLKNYESKESQLINLIEQVSLKMDGSIVCPKCSHEFLLDEDIEKVRKKKKEAVQIKPKVEELVLKSMNAIDEIKTNLSTVESSVSNINKKEQKENEEKQLLIIACNKVDKKLRKVEKKLERLKNELKDCDRDIDTLEANMNDLSTKIENRNDNCKILDSQIENFKTKIEDLNKEINNLKVGNNKKVIAELKIDLTKLEKNQSLNKSELSKVADQIYDRNQWSNNFKQFRMFLANQSLEVIGYHFNRYLEGMGSDISIKMDGFKVRADGTIKEEITAKVIRDIERTFDSFSGGEKSILLFTSILTNRHMINETHPYGGLDFLSIDEVLEGADSLILKHTIEAAKKLNVAVMIITHVTDEEANSDRILIVKENNVSRIEK